MVYSFWIVFFLIIFGMILRIRSTKAKYLLEKAEEQRKAEIEARMNKTTGEMLTSEHRQGQPAPPQGQIPDFSKMLGAQGRKDVN
jgi:hypothetical protein